MSEPVIYYPAKEYPVNFGILLEQVNKIRIALGVGEGRLEQLPAGKPDDPRQCVLARALSNGWRANVGDTSIVLSHSIADLEACATALKRLRFRGVHVTTYNEVVFDTTKTMRNFVLRYDEEQFPDLILGY